MQGVSVGELRPQRTLAALGTMFLLFVLLNVFFSYCICLVLVYLLLSVDALSCVVILCMYVFEGVLNVTPGCLTGLTRDSKPSVFSDAAILFVYCRSDKNKKVLAHTPKPLGGGSISGKNFF